MSALLSIYLETFIDLRNENQDPGDVAALGDTVRWSGCMRRASEIAAMILFYT
jgi:hypothetical protein